MAKDKKVIKKKKGDGATQVTTTKEKQTPQKDEAPTATVQAGDQAYGRNIAPLLTSLNQNWITPPDLFGALNGVFHFELDPATTSDNPLGTKYIITKDTDALQKDWLFDFFLNPPFSEVVTDENGQPIINKKGKVKTRAWLHKWVAHASEQARKNNVTGVVICAVRSETEAFQKYGFPNMQAICMLNKRVSYIDPDHNMQKLSPTFGSVLFIFKKDPMTKEQVDLLNSMGTLLKLYSK